ncbi:MAG: hypothetical protein KA112_04420 [Alphaproteobacteria bacterium]|nr:hypothetical protein [Alphaproteobacteria bacterium]
MPIVASSVNGFWKRKKYIQAERLCFSVFSQARMIFFYDTWGVPDSLEGRFDCACLHLALLLKHLKGSLAQAVFDGFFSYTELTLREVGVSDLRVGKQVKKCAQFFYGALKAYTDALNNPTGLEEALSRNLYGGTPPQVMSHIINYVKACDHLLEGQDFENIMAIEWPHKDNEYVINNTVN